MAVTQKSLMYNNITTLSNHLNIYNLIDYHKATLIQCKRQWFLLRKQLVYRVTLRKYIMNRGYIPTDICRMIDSYSTRPIYD
jgi:hypothetical protein